MSLVKYEPGKVSYAWSPEPDPWWKAPALAAARVAGEVVAKKAVRWLSGPSTKKNSPAIVHKVGSSTIGYIPRMVRSKTARTSRRTRKVTRSRKAVTARSRPRKVAVRRIRRRVSRKYRTPSASRSFEAKVLKAISPIQTAINTYSGVITSNVNQCSYGILGAFLHTRTCYNSLYLNNNGLTGSTNATQVDIETASLEMNLVNQDTAFVNITMYMCMPRRDFPQDNASASSLVSLIGSGFTTNGFTGGSTNSQGTLFNSKDFCEYFKVMKSYKFRLQPGGVRRFNLKGRPRRIGKAWATSNTAPEMHRGYTKFWVFRLEGQVANDNTTKTNVGLSGSKVDLLAYERYTYRFANPLTSNFAGTGSLGSITTAAFINTDTGSATTESTA